MYVDAILVFDHEGPIPSSLLVEVLNDLENRLERADHFLLEEVLNAPQNKVPKPIGAEA